MGGEGEDTRGRTREPGTLGSVAFCPYQYTRCDIVKARVADRMTFIVINALSAFTDLKVISAASMLRVGRFRRLMPRLGRTLGARFIVTGHIRHVDQTLEVEHAIFDTSSGERRSLPAVRIALDSLYDIYQTVVPRLLVGIMPDLRDAQYEAALADPPADLKAVDHVFRALMAIRKLTPTGLDEAERHLIEAQRRDPCYALAYAWNARILSLRVGQGWARDATETAEAAIRLSETARRLDPDNALALATHAHLRSYLYGDFKGALAMFDEAISVGPNEPMAWLMSSATLAYVGRGREGLARAKYAFSLSPIDRLAFIYHSFAATSAYSAGDYVETIRLARLSLAENPNYSATLRLLACGLAALGRTQEAREFGARLVELQPGFPANAERLILFQDGPQRELCFAHLRLAGVLPPPVRGLGLAAE